MNTEIRAQKIRVIDSDGHQLGVMSPKEAIEIAEQRGQDLVQIAPNAQPPVCKIMDFGKFRYEQQKKEKLQRKKQQIIIVKEIRFHPNTDTHDFEFKMRHARQFLEEGNKVKASVVFKGRQMAHQEFGKQILDELTEKLSDIATVERQALMEGRHMVAIYALDKTKKKKTSEKSRTKTDIKDEGKKVQSVDSNKTVEAPAA